MAGGEALHEKGSNSASEKTMPESAGDGCGQGRWGRRLRAGEVGAVAQLRGGREVEVGTEKSGRWAPAMEEGAMGDDGGSGDLGAAGRGIWGKWGDLADGRGIWWKQEEKRREGGNFAKSLPTIISRVR